MSFGHDIIIVIEKIDKKSVESRLETTTQSFFEVVPRQVLQIIDIERDERALIKSASGNEYMIVRSEGGKFVLYDRRVGGYNPNSGFSFSVDDLNKIAEVGKPFRYFAVLDEANMRGLPGMSTPVVAIDILKKRNAKSQSRQNEMIDAKGLAQLLYDEVHGIPKKSK